MEDKVADTEAADSSEMNETEESSSAEVVPPVDSAAQDENKASECPLKGTEDAAGLEKTAAEVGGHLSSVGSSSEDKQEEGSEDRQQQTAAVDGHENVAWSGPSTSSCPDSSLEASYDELIAELCNKINNTQQKRTAKSQKGKEELEPAVTRIAMRVYSSGDSRRTTPRSHVPSPYLRLTQFCTIMSPSTSRGALILERRRRIALIRVEETSRDAALEPRREDSLSSTSSRNEGDRTSVSSLQKELGSEDLQRRVNTPCSSRCATPCPSPACSATASGTENTRRTADSEERHAEQEQQEAAVNVVSQCCCGPVCAAVEGRVSASIVAPLLRASQSLRGRIRRFFRRTSATENSSSSVSQEAASSADAPPTCVTGDVAANVSLRGPEVDAEPVLPQPAAMQDPSRRRLQLPFVFPKCFKILRKRKRVEHL